MIRLRSRRQERQDGGEEREAREAPVMLTGEPLDGPGERQRASRADMEGVFSEAPGRTPPGTAAR